MRDYRSHLEPITFGKKLAPFQTTSPLAEGTFPMRSGVVRVAGLLVVALALVPEIFGLLSRSRQVGVARKR